jgi:uncharacterized protein YqhQ
VFCWLGCCALAQGKLPTYGGQAVIEGVMMRGRRFMTVAVRAPTDEIVLKTEPLPHHVYRGPLTKIPIVRGSLLLWDALVLGFRALSFSADVAVGESEPVEHGTSPLTWLTAGIGILLGMGLFFLLPAALTVPLHMLTQSSVLTNAIEGAIRVALLVGYIAVIGLMPDIRRVFMYHGAEHKAINAFEAGVPLEPEQVLTFSKRHPRCGTNFLLIVAVLSVVVFAAIGRPESWVVLLGSRIVLIPLIAGIAFELIRWSAGHMEDPLVRLFMQPGLALQSISTRDPDASQAQVAARALEELIRLETTEDPAHRVLGAS